MRVLALRACTKAPRNAAPSGPATEPEMVAASADDGTKARIPSSPRTNPAVERMRVLPMFLCDEANTAAASPPFAAQAMLICSARVPDTLVSRASEAKRNETRDLGATRRASWLLKRYCALRVLRWVHASRVYPTCAL